MARNNLTQLNPATQLYHKLSHDYGLFNSLQLAGSSFGIVTEFVYRIFDGPEILPVFALVYIEDESDIKKFEAAGNEGRYHLSLNSFQYFTSPNWFTFDQLVSE